MERMGILEKDGARSTWRYGFAIRKPTARPQRMCLAVKGAG